MPLSNSTSRIKRWTGYTLPYKFTRGLNGSLRNMYDTRAIGGAVFSGFATINCVAGASLVDGDYFTVSTGRRTRVFEFDSTATVTAGRIPVTFSGASTNTFMADQVATEINNAFSGTLHASRVGAIVTVVHLIGGATGATITENVANAGFTVANNFDAVPWQPVPVVVGGRVGFTGFRNYGA